MTTLIGQIPLSVMRACAAVLAGLLLAGCGTTIATPLPAPVATDRKDTAAEKAEFKRELAELEKKKKTHQQDAIKKIEGAR